jgi:hypothetical protein
VKATGHAGELRYRYQVAARLGKWTVEPVTGAAGHRFRVSATVVASIDPWVSRRPLDLYLTFGTSTWVWHGVNPPDIDTHVEIEAPHQPTIMQRSD